MLNSAAQSPVCLIETAYSLLLLGIEMLLLCLCSYRAYYMDTNIQHLYTTFYLLLASIACKWQCKNMAFSSKEPSSSSSGGGE